MPTVELLFNHPWVQLWVCLAGIGMDGTAGCPTVLDRDGHGSSCPTVNLKKTISKPWSIEIDDVNVPVQNGDLRLYISLPEGIYIPVCRLGSYCLSM